MGGCRNYGPLPKPSTMHHLNAEPSTAGSSECAPNFKAPPTFKVWTFEGLRIWAHRPKPRGQTKTTQHPGTSKKNGPWTLTSPNKGACIHIHTCGCVCLLNCYIYIYAYIYISIYTHMCTHIYIYTTCILANLLTCIYIYPHAYTAKELKSSHTLEAEEELLDALQVAGLPRCPKDWGMLGGRGQDLGALQNVYFFGLYSA